jgi:chromosome segregation ATPase
LGTQSNPLLNFGTGEQKMENLNAEQIKKALECCAADDGCVGEECPYYANCQFCITRISKDALALITSQEQRIKELAEKVENYRNELGEVRFALAEANNDRKELTEENERLHASCTELTQCCTKLETLYKIECKRVDTVKADTVRKLAESIKLEFYKEFDEIIPSIMADRIDQIAKEMLEGENER